MPLQAPDEAKKYTTVYGDFRGVDFTNDATNVWKRRSPTGLNMTPDMSGKPWKRTGWNIEVTEYDFKKAYEESTGNSPGGVLKVGVSIFVGHDVQVGDVITIKGSGQRWSYDSSTDYVEATVGTELEPEVVIITVGENWEMLHFDKGMTILSGVDLSFACRVEILKVYSFELAGQDHLIIFCNIGVFGYTDNKLKHLLTDEDITANPNRGFFFEGGGNAGFYFYGGFKMYGYVYENGFVCKTITPYIPTTLIGRKPNGGGTVLEDVNILSGSRTESFMGDGVSEEFFVSKPIVNHNEVEIKVLNENGEFEIYKQEYTVKENSIKFGYPPDKAEATDNVRITYPATSVFTTNTDYFTINPQTKVSTLPANNPIFSNQLSSKVFYDIDKKRYGDVRIEYLMVPEGTTGGASKPAEWVDSNIFQNREDSISNIYLNGESDGKTVYFYTQYTTNQLILKPANVSPNVRVTYPTEKAYKTELEKAFYGTKTNAIYGTGLINSVFVGGCDNENYSSRVWYSQVADPTYFPDLNYFEAGSNDTKIMGLTKVGEYLGVIKQGNATDSTIYLAYPVSFDEDTAYAVKQSVNGIGAVSRDCFDVLGDETLFLSKEGVMAIEPTSNENERQVKNRSYYINKKLLSEMSLENAFSFVWNGFYILCVNSHCYILDGAQKSSWVNEKTNLQYECYYWENVPAVCFAQYNDDLWFADDKCNLCRFKTYEKDGMSAYSDNGEIIPCEWSTILDNDGATNFFKNLQKKGCLVTILPMDKTSAKILLKADDKELIEVGEIVSENAKLPQEFYLNKKVKKYKRLQIIVKNEALDEGLGIQEIVKIYTMGNYSKNRSVNNGT